MTRLHPHTPNGAKHGKIYLVLIHLVSALGLAVVLALVFGWVVMELWNLALPQLLSVRHATYWQSVELLILMRILVGGLHHGTHGRSREQPPAPRHGEAWRQYDEWWREVGEKSFQEFSPAAEKQEQGPSDAMQ